MIPTTINYPQSFDSDQNLFEVNDGLRLLLIEDYKPGDTSIFFSGDEDTISRFPDQGFITLTEQNSDPENRAISFYYTSKTTSSFSGLELLPGFNNVCKPKNITNITRNVMAHDHNMLKDSLIAIQNFIGIKDTVGVNPAEGTLEERTNFLRNLVLKPKAWFTCNKKLGNVPMTVEFRDLSFRTATDNTDDEVTYIWDFGDNTDLSQITLITATDEVSTELTNVLVQDLNGGTIQKTYTSPGLYDVKLTVRNKFGEDIVIFPELINARIPAPEEAIIKFISKENQIITEGIPENGPYTTNPVVRACANNLVDIEIELGTNPNTGLSYSGEELNASGSPIDAIKSYTWELSDDLLHNNSRMARAVYTVGGLYDLTLRVDTSFGAYTITNYPKAIDIVEKTNLWLWGISNNLINANEFGLISETFKTSSTNYTISRNSSFLDNLPNSAKQKFEFERNCGFSPRGTTTSGENGTGVLFWASGRDESDSATTEKIQFVEYNGFTNTYSNEYEFYRPWNWLSLVSNNDIFFFLGTITGIITPMTSPTNKTLSTFNLQNYINTDVTFDSNNYENGAEELTENVATFSGGNPINGHLSTYRTAWKDNAGYILRNDGVGSYFRIKSFYRTEGVLIDLFQSITKLNDMTGPTKTEGQLVTLSHGVYFFNNSGSVSTFNTNTNSWETGGPGLNSASFRNLQDISKTGFDDYSNTLLATTDSDKKAYLSFDYSNKAFIRFNEYELTFSLMNNRPIENQWQMSIY